MNNIIESLISILKNNGIIIEKVIDGKKLLVVNDEINTSIIEDEREIDINEDVCDEIKIPKSKMEQINIVFDFWNSYKGKNWKSHIKLSHNIQIAILDALKNFSVEEICQAIDNYHTVLTNDKYFWSHTWTLPVFLSVKYGNAKNSPKKWWQFLSDNFIPENYLSITKKHDNTIDIDENPDLTKRIIKMYSILVNNRNYNPQPHQLRKFIEASKMMIKFFKDRNLGDDIDPVECLKHCLSEYYINKGEVLFPGHTCSKNTWEILMPQAISELGY